MFNFKSGTLLTCIATLALGTFSTPKSADAQLFPRLYQRRCCPNVCCNYRVVVPVTSPCCGQDHYTPSNIGYSAGYSQVNSGFLANSSSSYSGDLHAAYRQSNQPPQAVFHSESTVHSAPGYINDNQDSPDYQKEDSGAADWNSNDAHSNSESQQQASIQTPEWNADQQQTQTGNRDNQDQKITSIYAGKLFMANHCTIELGEMAKGKATNDDVKKFAETLADEHRQLNDKLRQMAPTEIVSTFSGSSDNAYARNDSETNAQTRDDADRTTVGRINYDQSTGPIVKQMFDIEKQAAKNALEATRQMLDNYSGEDFDMGFVGTQIANHTQMLAHLKAMKNVGTDEFQQLVSGAIDSVESHLRKARELSRQLDDENSRRADDSDDLGDISDES